MKPERSPLPSSKENPPDKADSSHSGRTKRWVGLFWILFGAISLLITLLFFGLRYEILFPALVLIGYGLFLLWDPPIAESDAPWTGVLWVMLGLCSLLVIRLFDFHWTVEVNGVIIGIFLVGLGMLVMLDL